MSSSQWSEEFYETETGPVAGKLDEMRTKGFFLGSHGGKKEAGRDPYRSHCSENGVATARSGAGSLNLAPRLLHSLRNRV